MAKFCTNCGTRCEDNDVFCAGCGGKLAAPEAPRQASYFSAPDSDALQSQPQPQPQYQAPQPQYQAPQPQYQAPQPQYQAPQPQAPAQTPEQKIRKNMKAFVAIFTAILLLAGIMNIFGLYDITMKASYDGESEKVDFSLSELRDVVRESLDESDGLVDSDMGLFEGIGELADNDLLWPVIQILCFYLSSYVLGIVGIIAGALAAYALYLCINGRAGSAKFFSRAIGFGGIGSTVAFIMALIGNKPDFSAIWRLMGSYYSSMSDISVSIEIHFTFWLAAIVGIAALYIRKGVLHKDLSPLQ